jgi:hypothetical protein
MVAGSDSTSNEVSQTPESAQHEHLRLTVLGANNTTLADSSIQLSARRFLMKLSSPIPRGSSVAITGNDDLLLGDVLECWLEDSGFHAIIQFEHSLRGIHQLRNLCSEFSS